MLPQRIKQAFKRRGKATTAISRKRPESTNPVWTKGGLIDADSSMAIVRELGTLLDIRALNERSLRALYTPMNRGKFRLLELGLDTERPAIPACWLKEKKVGAEGFVAVSYTWISEEYIWYGESLPHETHLRINDKIFRVRPQIALIVAMLFRLGIHTIWIDAICINQADEVEKGHQVARMDQIFSEASEVVMFLGKPTANTDETLKRIHEGITGAMRHIYDFVISDFDSIGWAGMSQIVRHEYWQRAWILQEIAHKTKKRRLLCGNVLLNSNATDALIRSFFRSHSKYRGERWYLTCVTQVAHGEKQSLLPLLASTRGAKCADHRDAIYAKLRLADGDDFFVREPDYTESPVNLFICFATAYILEHRNLEILRCVQEHQLSGLPSWVPDWTPQKDVSTWNFNSFTYNAEFLRSISTDEEDFDAMFRKDPLELHIRGRILTLMPSADELRVKASAHVRHGKGVNVDAFCEDLRGEYFMCSLIGLDVPVILAPQGDGYVYLNKDRSSTAARFWMQMAVNRVKKRVDKLRSEPLQWIVLR